MEFLLVSEAKLKIVLGDSELKKYNIDSVPTEGCGVSVRRSLWKILDLAKSEVGFDPSGDKVLIQFYPMRGGGCEIFVTKLGILSPSSARMIEKSDKVAMLSKETRMYCFEKLDDLLGAVRAVGRRAGNTKIESDVYILDETFYLSLDEYGKGNHSPEFPAIIEFGQCVPRDAANYIFEHAKKVTCGDGIDRFLAL